MDEIERFIEGMGRHFEEEGVPRIAGRLLGALIVNPEPSSLDDLTEQLQVSKGSVSSNARLLEQWGVAERVNLPGDRRDYYRIADDVEVRVLEQKVERIRRLLERLREGQEAVPEAVRPRLACMAAFHERALALLTEELDLRRRR